MEESSSLIDKLLILLLGMITASLQSGVRLDVGERRD